MRIAVVGAGFAGLSTAKVLRRQLLGVLAAADLLMTDLHVEPSPAAREGAAGPVARRRQSLDAWWVGRQHSRTDRAGVPSTGR
jgi:NADH dehydrogenase FAD-containing subunit